MRPIWNIWKEVLIDALVVSYIYKDEHEDDPRKALNDLICWEQTIALDPRVSADAAKLVEQGRAEGLDQARRMVVARFEDEAGNTRFKQGVPIDELEGIVDAAWCTWALAQIKQLSERVSQLEGQK